MTTIHDFSNVSKVDGVKGFYLAKYDGSGVAFKGDKADDIFPFIAFAGLNCDSIRSLLGYTRFNQIIFTRRCREDIIIFSLSNHFLAVMKEANTPTPDLVRKVNEFIQTTQKGDTAS